MADTPKRVIRLIDNIKLELYEGRKKYVQIWDPTGNNTYNEGDDGPSGIKSPEKSKKQASAEDDNNVIHLAIGESQIVEHYRVAANRSKSGKEEDIKPYFTYLQDPFSETPPPKRVYGGGGLGTPEVDNVGPTPYYLNNGCKVNIKWTGRVPNPDFKLGTFSTPTEQERYNKYLKPEGPPRFLEDKPILSDEDESNDKNTTLRPQSEWVLETGGYDPGDDDDTTNPLKINSDSFTYSVGYRDKPIVNDKFVSITLPTGFTENGGKGYLEWVGQGADQGLIYSTAPKGTISVFRGSVNSRGEGVGEEVDIKVKNHFNVGAHSFQKDENILKSIIQRYKEQVGKVYIIDYKDYDLKVCFPDTGTCSQIPYKSPIVDLSGVIVTPSGGVGVVGVTPSLIPKKVKLNVFGLPGVTSLSGETDGTIKVKVKVSLPDFTVYLGDPPGSTNSDASGLNPFGSVEDDVENPDPYEETPFIGPIDGGEDAVPEKTQYEQTASQEQQKKIAEKQNTEEAVASGTEKLPDGLKSLGTYYSEFPADSAKGGEVPSGFNGVPYYQQFDFRWANVIYGPSDGGTFVEAAILPRLSSKAKPPNTPKRVSVNWDGKTHVVNCDHVKGDNGYSDIHGGGCGITSISMIINYWAKKGKTGGKYTSPVKVAKLACESPGARPPANPATNGTQPVGSLFKNVQKHFGLTMNSVTHAEAKKLLQANNPCLFCGTKFQGKGADKGNSHNYGGHFVVFTGCDSEGRWRVNDPGGVVTKAGAGISYFDKFPDEKAFIGSGAFWAIGPPDVVK